MATVESPAHLNIEQIADELIGKMPIKANPLRFKEYLIEYLNEAYGVTRSALRSSASLSHLTPDIKCFVNAQSNTYSYQGVSELNNICGAIQLAPGRTGKREGKSCTITKTPDCGNIDFAQTELLYDSCAFTDVLTGDRVTPEAALQRQLDTLQGLPAIPPKTWLVSYDRLIDEKHVAGNRIKERWSVEEGELAVAQTVEAAKYLDSQRYRLDGYKLVMSCQGVDANQYQRCTEQVLEHCQLGDVLGLGGWCILGKQKRWLPVFWEVCDRVIPIIASAGIKQVHIFGCTWYKPMKGFPEPPLVRLLQACDEHGLSLSVDSRSPIGNALWKDTWKQAGATFPYWRHNLAWVKAELATLRDSVIGILPINSASPPQFAKRPKPVLPEDAPTLVTAFTCGGLFEIGAMYAGFRPVLGIEAYPAKGKKDDLVKQRQSAAAADNYERNFGDRVLRKTIEEAVRDRDFALFVEQHGRPSAFHCSPSCTNLSAGNTSGVEDEGDISAATAVTEAIAQLDFPGIFTLENVEAYAKSESWQIIRNFLYLHGYGVAQDVVMASDYGNLETGEGVPQDRKRFIVRAIKGHFAPPLPLKVPQRMGWYCAIADLLDNLPDGELAPWQLERLPQLVKDLLIDPNNPVRNYTTKEASEPSFTIAATHTRRPITTPCVFLVDGANIHPNGEVTAKDAQSPGYTITSSLCVRDSHVPRALFIDGRNERSACQPEHPAPTVTDWSRGVPALLIERTGASDERITTRAPEEPAWTLRSSIGTDQRGSSRNDVINAVVGGRVKKLNARAIARLQSVPDWYELPDQMKFAGPLLGNGVPPLLSEAIMRCLRRFAERPSLLPFVKKQEKTMNVTTPELTIKVGNFVRLKNENTWLEVTSLESGGTRIHVKLEGGAVMGYHIKHVDEVRDTPPEEQDIPNAIDRFLERNAIQEEERLEHINPSDIDLDRGSQTRISHNEKGIEECVAKMEAGVWRFDDPNDCPLIIELTEDHLVRLKNKDPFWVRKGELIPVIGHTRIGSAKQRQKQKPDLTMLVRIRKGTWFDVIRESGTSDVNSAHPKTTSDRKNAAFRFIEQLFEKYGSLENIPRRGRGKAGADLEEEWGSETLSQMFGICRKTVDSLFVQVNTNRQITDYPNGTRVQLVANPDFDLRWHLKDKVGALGVVIDSDPKEGLFINFDAHNPEWVRPWFLAKSDKPLPVQKPVTATTHTSVKAEEKELTRSHGLKTGFQALPSTPTNPDIPPEERAEPATPSIVTIELEEKSEETSPPSNEKHIPTTTTDGEWAPEIGEWIEIDATHPIHPGEVGKITSFPSGNIAIVEFKNQRRDRVAVSDLKQHIKEREEEVTPPPQSINKGQIVKELIIGIKQLAPEDLAWVLSCAQLGTAHKEAARKALFTDKDANIVEATRIVVDNVQHLQQEELGVLEDAIASIKSNWKAAS